VLIGMMGSGKSTVGRLLSGLTDWTLVDNDELLRRQGGVSAREILEERGVIALRGAEADALRLGLAQPAPCIVDAAGGTILDPELRAALADEIVVWLRARPETLFRRAKGARHRPWLDRGQEWMRNADAERAPLYEAVADLIVDTDQAEPDEVAEKIHAWLATTAPCATQ
jgi:shikimate kinase